MSSGNRHANGSDMSLLSVECGPLDDNGRHNVVTTYGQKHHPDRIDVASGWQREQWRERVVKALGLEPPWNPATGGNYDRIYADLEQRLMAAAAKQAANPLVDTIEAFTFAELRREFPRLRPAVVEGLGREGELMNLISVSKIGKSWLAYLLALSIITGRAWLGRFPTVAGRVLLIDNELHRETLAHRIPLVAEALGLFPDDWESQLDVWPLRGNHRSLEGLRHNMEAIEPGTYQAVILDAKYRFLPEGVSENDNAAETQAFNLLDQYAAHTNAMFVLIHHSSKGEQGSKRTTDVGSGAGAQSRAADAHVVLREHEDQDVVVLDAAVRSFAPVKPLALRWAFPLWEPELSVDPQKLKGRQSPQERRQSDRDKEAVDKIMAALLKGPATSRQLREKTGLSRERQERLLDLLVSQEHLATEEIDIRGNVCKQYSIANPSP